MDITLTPKDATTASLKVTIATTDYQSTVDSKLKEIAKKAQIKGFRPGKVPVGLIKQRHGKEVLFEEVNKILNSSVQEYLQESDMIIVGEILPSQDQKDIANWDAPTDFEFNFELGHASPFQLKLDDSIEVTQYEIPVEDEIINQTIDNILQQNPQTTNPEEAKTGDTIFGHMKQVDGDFELDNAAIPTDKLTDEYKQKIEGLKVDEELTFTFDKAFEDDNAIKHVLGLYDQEVYDDLQDKDFVFTTKSITRQDTAKLDEALFARIFPNEEIKDEEAFKAKISEILAENFEKESKELLSAEAMDAVIEQNPFDLPEDFLKNWLTNGTKEEETKEILDKWDLSRRQFKMSVIRLAIGKIDEYKERVQVSEEEIVNQGTQQMAQQFAQYGINPNDPAFKDQFSGIVHNFLTSNDGENYQRISREISGQKYDDLILSKVKINKESLPTRNAFEEKVKAYNQKVNPNAETDNASEEA